MEKNRWSLVLWLAAGSVVAALLIAAAVTRDSTESGTTDGPPATAKEDNEAGDEPELDMSRRDDADPLAMGPVDAPVVMVEYADFRCPFCGVFARDIQPELITRYVDEGILRIEWRDLPMFGDQSVDSALAARAAGNQNRFWEFHAAVYANAPDSGKPDLSRDTLIALAEEAGVPDLEQLEADMDDPDLRAAVQADLDEATSLGATSTPVFLINDEPVVGAQPVEVFADAIEAEAREN